MKIITACLPGKEFPRKDPGHQGHFFLLKFAEHVAPEMVCGGVSISGSSFWQEGSLYFNHPGKINGVAGSHMGELGGVAVVVIRSILRFAS